MTSYLKVIKPISLTLDASNATESTPAWVSGTTYALDDEVSHDDRIWKSTTGSNTGNTPSDASTYWSNQRATNPHRCLDLKQTSETESAGTLEMTLTAGGIGDAIAFIGIDAASVQVTVTDTGAPFYDSGEIDLVSSESVFDMWSYTYAAIDYIDELILPVPVFSGMEIEIVIDAGSGTASLGELIVGATHSLGISRADAISLTDYSIKEKDDFGDAYITERAYSFSHDFEFAFPKDDSRRVTRLLAELRATPSLYFAAEDQMEYGATIFGWVEDWSAPLSSERYVFATATIEGLS